MRSANCITRGSPAGDVMLPTPPLVMLPCGWPTADAVTAAEDGFLVRRVGEPEAQAEVLRARLHNRPVLQRAAAGEDHGSRCRIEVRHAVRPFRGGTCCFGRKSGEPSKPKFENCVSGMPPPIAGFSGIPGTKSPAYCFSEYGCCWAQEKSRTHPRRSDLQMEILASALPNIERHLLAHGADPRRGDAHRIVADGQILQRIIAGPVALRGARIAGVAVDSLNRGVRNGGPGRVADQSERLAV